jgi:hypothetical protein
MAEEAAPTAQRRFSAVWIGGSVITGLPCRLGAAVFHTPWITPVLVWLGACALTPVHHRMVAKSITWTSAFNGDEIGGMVASVALLYHVLRYP